VAFCGVVGSIGRIGADRVERLDLRLLVDGVDRGRDRWGQVQADQVADLLDQVRIGRDLELVLSPGLEPEARQISLTVCRLTP